MRNSLIVAALLVVTAVAAAVTRREDSLPASPRAMAPSSPRPEPRPERSSPSGNVPHDHSAFVGSGACAACHRAESEAYANSHHAKALLKPASDSRAHFDGARFTSKLGGTTTFAWRDGAAVASTPVPGGKTRSFPVTYVSGVWPLEQYVVETERGKLQSLGVVWDSRSAETGGNRWFHVYGASGIAPNDPLFFTSPAQNFNHQCADCHSTFVERRYDCRCRDPELPKGRRARPGRCTLRLRPRGSFGGRRRAERRDRGPRGNPHTSAERCRRAAGTRALPARDGAARARRGRDAPARAAPATVEGARDAAFQGRAATSGLTAKSR